MVCGAIISYEILAYQIDSLGVLIKVVREQQMDFIIQKLVALSSSSQLYDVVALANYAILFALSWHMWATEVRQTSLYFSSHTDAINYPPARLFTTHDFLRMTGSIVLYSLSAL